MLTKIKAFLKETPNSVLFWNGVILATLITIGVIDLTYLIVVLFFGSLLTIAVMIASLGGNGNIKNHLWINFMPVTWFAFLMVTIIEGIITFNCKFIIPFNKWLNKSRK